MFSRNICLLQQTRVLMYNWFILLLLLMLFFCYFWYSFVASVVLFYLFLFFYFLFWQLLHSSVIASVFLLLLLIFFWCFYRSFLFLSIFFISYFTSVLFVKLLIESRNDQLNFSHILGGEYILFVSHWEKDLPIYLRSVFKNLPKYMMPLKAVNYFGKKIPSYMFW